MSYYQNGGHYQQQQSYNSGQQQQHSQYQAPFQNHSQQAPPLLPPHDPQQQQQQQGNLQRTSSFDNGDDGAYGVNTSGVVGYGGEQYGYGSEAAGASAAGGYTQAGAISGGSFRDTRPGANPRRADELYISTGAQQQPGARVYAGGGNGAAGGGHTGYQQQVYQQVPNSPPPPSPYNPQQYSQQQHGASVPYPASSRQTAYGATMPAHPAPYNPAAYQSTNAPSTSQYGYTPATYAPATYSPPVQYPAVTPPSAHHSQYSAGSAGGFTPPQNLHRVPTGGYFPAQPTSRNDSYGNSAPVAVDSFQSDRRRVFADRQASGSPRHQYSQTIDAGGASPNHPSSLRTHPSQHQSRGSNLENSSDSPYYTSDSVDPYAGSRPYPPRQGSLGATHPHSRPLPAQPQDSGSESDYAERPNGAYGSTDEMQTQAALFEQLEEELQPSHSSRSPRIEIDQYPDGHGQVYSPPIARDGMYHQSGQHPNRGAETNGDFVAMPAADDYDGGSDAEAEAGLAAMQMADEQEAAEEARRRSGSHEPYAQRTDSYDSRHLGSIGSDDNFGNIDLGSYTGGPDLGRMSYGGYPDQLAAGGAVNGQDSYSHPVSSSGSMRRSDAGEGDGTLDYGGNSIHPFPPFRGPPVRVDTHGTGGLVEPSPQGRRLSYDEGSLSDEMSMHSQTPGPAPSEPPEMFYHPGLQSRPLPPPPAGANGRSLPALPTGVFASESQRRPALRHDPDSFTTTPGGSVVPRSASMLNQTTSPVVNQPLRSKTDAEERRLRAQKLGVSYGPDDLGGSAGGPEVGLDLPSLPAGKRFNPAKLTAHDFKRCEEPWALSSVLAWIKSLAELEVDLKRSAIIDGLVALFTFKVPTLNVASAEAISAMVVADMFKAGALVHEEEWLKFGIGTMSGIIYQLTGMGCYSSRLHEHHAKGRCYSYHCQRTLKKIDLQSHSSSKQAEDWQTYYKIKKEDVEGVTKKEIERQNILHEVVSGEDKFLGDCSVVQRIYRDTLEQAKPPIISPRKIKSFIDMVYGRIDAVARANSDHLLPQLRYRQQEQGPWISGFSDIFREWIRKGRIAFIEYAAALPNATFLVRREAERNVLFRTFLDQARGNKASNKLSWDSFLKAPITRLQRYPLLLESVLKNSVQDTEEKANLRIAIDEIKAVAHECDTRFGEMQRKVDLTDLQSKLILRPGMQRVELNLDHLGRKLIFQGDLQRVGSSRFNWVETHALLFDHFLVLAKKVSRRDDEGGSKYERYDVSRLPISMDLLVLESTNDDPVIKQVVKGISVSTVTKTAGTQDPRLTKQLSSQSQLPGSLVHTPTTASTASGQSSLKSTTTATSLESNSKDSEKIIYPFRIKHLGKEVFTLYAPTAANRQEWCDKIVEAKTMHATALFRQNAEPFRLRIVADSSFSYESGTVATRGVTIEGTPLDRALRDVDRLFMSAPRPSPVCRAKVNCATAFIRSDGKAMNVVGTDFGVYFAASDNPRGWSRAITAPRVTQIAVLEEFSLMLVISDKALIAHHLDVVCPVSGPPGAASGGAQNDSARKSPQKLSGSRDVGFFATGQMKDRTLVVYKKRDGISSVFKVLEPIFQKSTEKKSRFMRSGRTEFFRDFDDFYIAAECYGINLFHSSLSVSTAKGIEVLTLDKKQPWSVPDLKQPAVAQIASRIANQMPLGMFRLSDQEFLLAYQECAVYVNKHGDISRSVVMEFEGKASAAALYGPYVLLFDSDFLEIRNAQNGYLRQVIPGRDIKLLDDAMSGGSAGRRSVKISLQHPDADRLQIVAELVLNEGLKE